jgi:hypothetical protein
MKNSTQTGSNKKIGFLLTLLSIFTFLLIMLAPYWEKNVFSADDLGFYLFSRLSNSLWTHLVLAWNSGLFRPLDVLASRLGDPVSRKALHSVSLHFPAILAILMGLWYLIRRIGGKVAGVSFGFAWLWWMLNPGTTVTIWQPDTISQSWSGAAGLWLVIVLWSAANKINEDKSTTGLFAAEVFICLLGVFTKETFMGWAAAGGLLLAVLYLKNIFEGRKTGIWEWIKLTLPITVIPALYLFARFRFGGLGSMLSGSSSRYSLHFGFSLVKNIVTAGAGFLCVGPAHLVSVPDASLFLRGLPFLGILLTVCVLLLPLVISRTGQKKPGENPRWSDAWLIALVCFASLSPTLISGGFSELYLMGPNAGAALLVGISLAFALERLDKRRKETQQAAAFYLVVLAAVVLLAIGWLGVFSRAQYFGRTWHNSRVYNNAIMRWQSNRESSPAPSKVMLRRNCAEGPVHSVYVLPPAQALNVEATEMLLNRLHPDKKINIFVEPKSGPAPQADFIVDCSNPPGEEGK